MSDVWAQRLIPPNRIKDLRANTEYHPSPADWRVFVSVGFMKVGRADEWQ